MPSKLADLRRRVFEAQYGLCFWPSCSDPAEELAHLEHRGRGGNPDGSRNVESNVVGLCRMDHAALDGRTLLSSQKLEHLVAAVVPEGRALVCGWPDCQLNAVGLFRVRPWPQARERGLCEWHGEIVDTTRPVAYRRREISSLLRARKAVDGQSRPV